MTHVFISLKLDLHSNILNIKGEISSVIIFRIYYTSMNTNIFQRALRPCARETHTPSKPRAASSFSNLLWHFLYVPSSMLLLRSFISSWFLLQSNGSPTTCAFSSPFFFLIYLIISHYSYLFPYLLFYIYSNIGVTRMLFTSSLLLVTKSSSIIYVTYKNTHYWAIKLLMDGIKLVQAWEATFCGWWDSNPNSFPCPNLPFSFHWAASNQNGTKDLLKPTPPFSPPYSTPGISSDQSRMARTQNVVLCNQSSSL